MHHFQYRGDHLMCEEVPIERIAEEVGTPFYLYSHATLAHHFRTFDQAFADIPHLVCFAMKANSNGATLKLFADLGGGADVVSGGELYRAMRAGIPPSRIVFAGVGKTREEMDFALKSDILMFNVESPQELRLLNDVAEAMGTKARVALRINPDVDPKTHPYISTGLKKSKFGIDISLAMEEYRVARELRHIEVVGVHQHIGSQITEIAPFVDSLAKIAGLIAELRDHGFAIKYLDVGGGLGITYKDENPPVPRVFAEAMIAVVKDLDCTIVLEPGRVIVGNAGVLVTRVLYDKRTPAKHFIIVDAGMNDLVRPSLYGSFHSILPARREKERETVVADVVGPVCESGDFLAKDRSMPAPEPGELLVVMSAGAYGHTMSSNYNSRPRLPEILVKGDRIFTIRERESYEDLVRSERLPPDL
ncbi:MAG: diaminopimelate decarboxylase [candidate division NC10 bacterium]|nr:diaminopimelate decarboxylase [candidate division NC10 bacterium]MDE2322589.1 diaminopimelate decarboxylase [candidate division NC10 bacterium]